MPHPYLAKIVLGYALVAFLYITLSDALLFEFWPRAQDVPAVSMVKGWGFVLVTTATLWLLLRRLQRAENSRYRVLLDNHHAVVLVVDPDTHYIVDASPAAATFYGWSRTELLKKRIDEINILDSAGILEEVKRATANTVPVFHFQHRLASDEVRHVDVYSGPIDVDGQHRLLSVIHDVTPLHETTRKLQHLNWLYSLLYRMAELLPHARDTISLYQQLCDIAVNDGHFNCCWLGLRQPDGSLNQVAMTAVGLCTTPALQCDSGTVSGIAEQALATGRAVIGSGAAGPCSELQGSCIAVPFTIANQVAGVICFNSSEQVLYGERALSTLTEIAGQLSYALENIHRMRALETSVDVIEKSPVVLFRWRAGTGWPVEFVSGNVAQWGYRVEDLLSGAIPFADLVHPDDLERVGAEVARYVEAGTAQFQQIYRLRNSDGVTRWVEDSSTVEYDGQGSPLHFQGTLTDITDLRRVEHALRDSEQRYRRILEHSPDIIFTNRDDCVSYINPTGVKKLRARDAAALLGRSIYTLFVPEAHDRIRARTRQLRTAPGTSVSNHYELMQADDGTLVHTSVSAVSYGDDGGLEILVTCRDVSEQQQAKATIADYVKRLENSVLGTAAAVSHMVELRDPYTAGHEWRVGELAAAIAVVLGMDDFRQRGLRLAGAVHDIGKIRVPAEILVRPGRLSVPEFELIKEHAEQGYRVLKDIDFPWPIAETVRQHHERLDGSGYPAGLVGDAILLEARIIAVADVVESMASHRPYRPAHSMATALAEIRSGAGCLFDAEVVQACCTLFEDRGYVIPAGLESPVSPPPLARSLQE